MRSWTQLAHRDPLLIISTLTFLSWISSVDVPVCALDGLLGAGDGGVLAGAEGGDTGKLGAAVTALGGGTLLLDVKVTELATGGLGGVLVSRSCGIGLSNTDLDLHDGLAFGYAPRVDGEYLPRGPSGCGCCRARDGAATLSAFNSTIPNIQQAQFFFESRRENVRRSTSWTAF